MPSLRMTYFAIRLASAEKLRKDREARISLKISYKKCDLREMGYKREKVLAEFKQKKELEKLCEDEKLSPFQEEDLIALEKVLEVWDRKRKEEDADQVRISEQEKYTHEYYDNPNDHTPNAYGYTAIDEQ